MMKDLLVIEHEEIIDNQHGSQYDRQRFLNGQGTQRRRQLLHHQHYLRYICTVLLK